jgi:general secretion pathway protein B
MWIGLAALLPVAAWIAYGMVRSEPATPMASDTIAAQSPVLTPVRHLEAPAVAPAIRPDVPPSADQPPVARMTTAPDTPTAPADDEPESAAELAASIAARAQAAARSDHEVVAPPAPVTSPGRTLSLSDLSSDERKALPPLKMSMHLWNEDASQRFVIIDGDRLHEGDHIGNAVVTAIVSDGVLLDWNGRRLKLPIR